MAWLACGCYNDEFIFNYKPHRDCVYASNDERIEYWEGFRDGSFIDNPVELPKGSIKKLIGKDLSWEDEPVELENE
nr:MAG TPA: hypothetical protein [Caudoviricetes sp.]